MSKQQIKKIYRIAGISLFMMLSCAVLAATETKGPNGERATPHTAVQLTDVEKDSVRAKQYTAAILMHSTSTGRMP